jgi:ATP-dependent RNA helicase MSS116
VVISGPGQPQQGQPQQPVAAQPAAAQSMSASSLAPPAAGFLPPTAASSGVRFSEVAGISDPIRAAVNDMRFEYMTEVQAQTLPIILGGVDCLAKAKTGTGKTLGFTIPALEVILRAGRGGAGQQVQTLCLSPTRELASQIETEARKLTKYMPVQITCVIGGTNIKSDQRSLAGKFTHVLIATPGRLIDHLENTPGFAQSVSNLRVLILDEADQLLEMGFKPEIDKILSYLPAPASRQTLLFSATVPANVQAIANRALRPGYRYIDTVGEEEPTHLHVKQEIVVLPIDRQVRNNRGEAKGRRRGFDDDI